MSSSRKRISHSPLILAESPRIPALRQFFFIPEHFQAPLTSARLHIRRPIVASQNGLPRGRTNLLFFAFLLVLSALVGRNFSPPEQAPRNTAKNAHASYLGGGRALREAGLSSSSPKHLQHSLLALEISPREPLIRQAFFFAREQLLAALTSARLHTCRRIGASQNSLRRCSNKTGTSGYISRP